MRRRLAILLLVCGGVALFLHREESHGTFDGLHARLLGWLGADRVTASPVTLVEVGRDDLPFEAWPPAPLDWALLFEKLFSRQPAAVAVQPVLAWPELTAMDESTVAERVTMLPRGVLACTLLPADAVQGAAPALELPVVGKIEGDLSRVPAFAGVGAAPPVAIAGSKATGFTRFDLQPPPAAVDHMLRLPLLARKDGKVVPSFILQTLAASRGLTPADVTGRLGVELRVGRDLAIPVDEAGRLHVHTRVPVRVPRLTGGDLLLDVDRDAGLLDGGESVTATLKALPGSVVVLGEAGEGAPKHALGGNRAWTEAEAIATALHACLTGRHVRELPPRWPWGLAGGAVVMSALLLRCARRWVFGFGLAGAAVLVLLAPMLFVLGQWWLPPFVPLALWIAGSTVAFLLPPPVPAPVPAPAAEAPPPAEPPAAEPAPDRPDEPTFDAELLEDPTPASEPPAAESAPPDEPPVSEPVDAVPEPDVAPEPAPDAAEPAAAKPKRKRAAKKAGKKK